MWKFMTREIVLVSGSPQFWWFSRRTHRTHYTVMLTAKVYDTERITKHNQPRATVHGKPSGGTRPRLPGPPRPVESHRMCSIPPAGDRDHMCSAVHQGGVRLCPGFLHGNRHEVTLCLARTNIPDSQKESRCGTNHIGSTHSLGTVSHFYHLGEVLY